MGSQFIHVGLGIFAANDFLFCFLGHFDLHFASERFDIMIEPFIKRTDVSALGRIEELEVFFRTASYCSHKFGSRMRDRRRGAQNASTKDLGTSRTDQEYRGN